MIRLSSAKLFSHVGRQIYGYIDSLKTLHSNYLETELCYFLLIFPLSITSCISITLTLPHPTQEYTDIGLTDLLIRAEPSN